MPEEHFTSDSHDTNLSNTGSDDFWDLLSEANKIPADTKTQVDIKWTWYIFENVVQWSIDDEMVDFYFEHRDKDQPAWVGSFYKSTTQKLANYKERWLLVLRTASWEIVGMSATSPYIFDEDKLDLGVFVISPEYKGKGLASFLAAHRISLIKTNVPEAEALKIEATTQEWLQFSIGLEKKIKKQLLLTIDYLWDAAEILIETIFSHFKDDLWIEPFDYYELYNENLGNKVSVDIPLSLKERILENYHWNYADVSELSLWDIIIGIIKELDENQGIDLFLTKDKEKLRGKLTDVGIIVST